MAKTTNIRLLQRLPDVGHWTNCFQVESNGRSVYNISQHKIGRHWGCSCAGWTTHRKCKHLTYFDLPANCEPKPLESNPYLMLLFQQLDAETQKPKPWIDHTGGATFSTPLPANNKPKPKRRIMGVS